MPSPGNWTPYAVEGWFRSHRNVEVPTDICLPTNQSTLFSFHFTFLLNFLLRKAVYHGDACTVGVQISDYSPSLEGKYSEHGSTRRARRAASRSSLLSPQVASSGELSRSFSVCLSRASPRRHLLHAGRGGTGAERWALAEFLCLFVTGVTPTSSTACWSGRDWCGAVSSRGVSLSVCHGRHPDVIYCMLVGEGLVRSGELSRSFSVCLSRASPRRHLLHAGRGGTGAERWALAEFLCLFVTDVTLTSSTACWSGRDWCGAVSSRGVPLSVCHGRHPDVIGMRQFWRDFCVNAQTWRGNFVKLRH